MSDRPKFAKDPFRRSESPDPSPHSSPLLPAAGLPRRASILRYSESYEYGGSSPPPSYVASFSRRQSNVGLLSYNDRKSSIATFHGDLVEQQTKKQKRNAWIRILFFATCLFAALLAGTAIGYWAIPLARRNPGSVTSGTVASPSYTDTPEHMKMISATKVTGTAKATPSTNTRKTSTSGASSTSTGQASATGISSSYWQPKSGTTFQIQLNTVLSPTSQFLSNIDVYDIDLFDTPASTIAALHAAGKKVICYFSAGSAENWRSDYSQFTAADLGNELDGWAGERWVYTPSSNVRKIMVARLQLAKTKGCDGVDPDNMDVYGYGSDSGFSDLTQKTAADYITYLANQAHALGLAIGLKNAGEIIPSVLPLVQWVVSEQCVQYQECDIYQPFITAGKPAFNIQYPFGGSSKTTAMTATTQSKFCTTGGANFKGFTNVLKHQNLDPWMFQC